MLEGKAAPPCLGGRRKEGGRRRKDEKRGEEKRLSRVRAAFHPGSPGPDRPWVHHDALNHCPFNPTQIPHLYPPPPEFHLIQADQVPACASFEYLILIVQTHVWIYLSTKAAV